MADKTTQNIIKYAYAWVAIMIVINILFAGYTITSSVDPLSINQGSLFDAFTDAESGVNTSITSIGSLNEDYDVNDLSSSGSQSGTILDALDQLWAFGKWTWFAVKFITFGGVFTGLIIQDMIANPFLSFISSSFMIIGNMIFIFLVYKFVMNKGRLD